MMLAFSWISFNGSSVLTTEGDRLYASAHAVVNTLLCMSASCVASVLLEYVSLPREGGKGTYDLPSTINGMLGGMVAVTGGCVYIDNWNAIALGVVSAMVSRTVSKGLLRCQVDDPLDAFAVHGANGVLGTVWIGFFARKTMVDMLGNGVYEGHYGLIDGGGAKIIWVQLLGCAVTMALVGTAMAGTSLLVLVVKSVLGRGTVVEEGEDGEESGGEDDDRSSTQESSEGGGVSLRDKVCLALRVSKDAEIVGADFIYHEGNAFELTNNQVKMYNLEKNAQERIVRRRLVRDERAKEKREGLEGREGWDVDGGMGGAVEMVESRVGESRL